MKVMVAVKQSAKLQSTADLDLSGTEISDKHVDYEINDSDEHAIEEAVQLSENASTDVEVVCVTIGPARTTEVLNYSLAMGADKAVRVWGDDLEDRQFLDPKTKAEILAAVVRDESPDLVFTGVESEDATYGATGVYLAKEVDYAWAAAATDIEIDEATAVVERETEGDVSERIELELPALVTIQAGLNEPRYVSLRTVYRTGKSPSETNLADLDVDDVMEYYTTTALEQPETETTFIDGDTENVSKQLLDVLEDEGVVQ